MLNIYTKDVRMFLYKPNISVHIFDSTKVTVCPPKNTLTNLNYDIEMLGNMTVNEEVRNELNKFIVDELHDPYFESIMKNLTAFHEENK